jgi:hypothetical protein
MSQKYKTKSLLVPIIKIKVNINRCNLYYSGSKKYESNFFKKNNSLDYYSKKRQEIKAILSWQGVKQKIEMYEYPLFILYFCKQ